MRSDTLGDDLADLALVHSLKAEIRALACAVDQDPFDASVGFQLCALLQSTRAAKARLARRRLIAISGPAVASYTWEGSP